MFRPFFPHVCFKIKGLNNFGANISIMFMSMGFRGWEDWGTMTAISNSYRTISWKENRLLCMISKDHVGRDKRKAIWPI